MKNLPILLLAILFFPSIVWGKPPELTSKDTKIKVEEILKAHATHHSLNQELIKRAYENYLHEIDPSFSYLLESEVVKWSKPSEELLSKTLESYKKEDFSPFEELHKIIIKGIERRRIIEKKLSTKTAPSDVDSEEFKDMNWVKTTEELETRILRIKGLQSRTAEKILERETKEIFFQRLDKRRQSKEDELIDPSHRKSLVLSYVLKSISNALDSQTAYFTPSEANQFMIQVQQRLFGIGAQLRDDLNGFSIVRVLENSPLSQNNKVQIGDRIIAVNNEPVIGLDITEAVELIRGPQGTSVLLTFIRKKEGTEEKFDVTLTRGEIVLKESRLEKSYEPFGKGVIGILKLYSFYQDPQYSSSADLSKAVQELQKDHPLKGIILDLRSNGGGLLPQAVAVAGLFMKKGVVVSVKDNTGFVQKLRNVESKTAWDGPLIILTNKASASAAEIVAQTLQEYGRAIVLGDEQTFGKGTFQTFTLETSNFGKVNPKGEYKVTRGRYYTVSGKSPQLVGVSSDIVIPSFFADMEIGEKYSKYPLETDQIAPSFEDDLSDIPIFHRHQALQYYKTDLQTISTTYQPHLEILKKNSAERLKLHPNYKNFLSSLSKKELSTLPSIGQNDLQLDEAVNVMKDLLMLLQNQEKIPQAA